LQVNCLEFLTQQGVAVVASACDTLNEFGSLRICCVKSSVYVAGNLHTALQRPPSQKDGSGAHLAKHASGAQGRRTNGRSAAAATNGSARTVSTVIMRRATGSADLALEYSNSWTYEDEEDEQLLAVTTLNCIIRA
jgi:hypothetical protein